MPSFRLSHLFVYSQERLAGTRCSPKFRDMRPLKMGSLIINFKTINYSRQYSICQVFLEIYFLNAIRARISTV